MSRKYLILFDSILLMLWVFVYINTGRILFIPMETIYQWLVFVLFLGMIYRHVNYYKLTKKIY